MPEVTGQPTEQARREMVKGLAERGTRSQDAKETTVQPSVDYSAAAAAAFEGDPVELPPAAQEALSGTVNASAVDAERYAEAQREIFSRGRGREGVYGGESIDMKDRQITATNSALAEYENALAEAAAAAARRGYGGGGGANPGGPRVGPAWSEPMAAPAYPGQFSNQDFYHTSWDGARTGQISMAEAMATPAFEAMDRFSSPEAQRAGSTRSLSSRDALNIYEQMKTSINNPTPANSEFNKYATSSGPFAEQMQRMVYGSNPSTPPDGGIAAYIFETGVSAHEAERMISASLQAGGVPIGQANILAAGIADLYAPNYDAVGDTSRDVKQTPGAPGNVTGNTPHDAAWVRDSGNQTTTTAASPEWEPMSTSDFGGDTWDQFPETVEKYAEKYGLN